jgi:hypothetical protein
MDNTILLDLHRGDDIKVVRLIKQYTRNASQCLDNGDMQGYRHWMGKAEGKHNELVKNYGIKDQFGDNAKFVTVPNTCKQVIVLY